jgi:hypothetical protein
VEKNIECMHLSKVKYVRFGRFFIYVFVIFEKEDSGNINPWWWWLRIGHSEGTWEDMSCCSQEYKYKSLRPAVMVSDMVRARGKMCVTCRSAPQQGLPQSTRYSYNAYISTT